MAKFKKYHVVPIARMAWKFPKEYERSVANLHERVSGGLSTYTISEDNKSITCHGCGRTSHCQGDVDHRFCPCADMFHDDLARAIMGVAENKKQLIIVHVAVFAMCFMGAAALVWRAIFHGDFNVGAAFLLLLGSYCVYKLRVLANFWINRK